MNKFACKHCDHNVDVHDEETGECLVMVPVKTGGTEHCQCAGWKQKESPPNP